MFDLGFSELFLIALVALVVLGPQRLPKAARFAGLWIQRARSQWQSVKSEFENELADEELSGSLRATRDELRDARRQLQERGESLRSEFEPDREQDEREQAAELDHDKLGSASDPELQALMEREDESEPNPPEPEEPGLEEPSSDEPGVDEPERREPRPDEPQRREPGTPEPTRRDPPPGRPIDPAPDKRLEQASMSDSIHPIAPDHHGRR